MDNHLIIVYF